MDAAEVLAHQLQARGIENPRVLAAVARVPRHRFVPPDLIEDAYLDRPLPIGGGQTISQPYIVARMTSLLALRPGDRVLEIGTGSGYQTALLAELAGAVYTIERNAPLALPARERLRDQGYRSIHFHVGDGTLGWPEAAPFDAIIVTAAGPRVPAPLAEQLARGGRLVMPVGGRAEQSLIRVVRPMNGPMWQETLEPVRFVPLFGRYGWGEDEAHRDDPQDSN